MTTVRRILFPMKIPILSTFFNGFLANLWIIRHLCLTYWIVARVQPDAGEGPSVSVVVPEGKPAS